MKVLIVGCGLAGLAAALSLSSKRNNANRNDNDNGDDDYDDLQITIVERRSDLESRGATFGLQLNGQKALQEIAPGNENQEESKVLQKLRSEGILIPSSGGYMLPWWKVRDALLDEVKARKDMITIHLGVSIDTIKERSSTSGNGPPLVATFKDSHMQIEADVIIGADGVNSYVRSEILQLPPAKPTNVFVWRGSVKTSCCSDTNDDNLKKFQEYPIAKFTKFGEAVCMTYFNFHQKVEGSMAWVFTCRSGYLPDTMVIDCGTTTPIDIIKAYMDHVDGHNDKELKANHELAMLAFANTHQPSDLTWSSEMAVVDLTQEDIGWGGRGNITLIGDAAHSLRPASGLGGSLAFEDAALLGRYIAKCIGGNASASIEGQLREFEKHRLPRCKSISNDQSIRSELSYKLGLAGVPQWDSKYRKWIDDGLDSSPEPPVCEMDVFAGLL